MRRQFFSSRVPSILALPLILVTAASLAGRAQTGSTTSNAPQQTLGPQTKQLRLVSTPWPPFTNPAGEPRFALDLVEAGLERIGVKTNTTIVEPALFTTSLLSADFDGSGAAWKDAERERVLIYSQPYLENRLILIGRKGADVSATTLAALKGKRIAIVKGYAYGDIDNAGPVFVRSSSEEDSMSRLLASTVDYVLMDQLVVEYILNNYPAQAQSRLSTGSAALITRPLHFAVKRSLPDAISLVLRFNEQLRSMIADKTYHRLLHVDWIMADVDGDGRPEYVPKNDRAGAAPPSHAYSLFTEPPSSNGPKVPDMSAPGFYVGGTIYPDWAAVPGNYKVQEPNRPPETSRSTASVFKFVW